MCLVFGRHALRKFGLILNAMLFFALLIFSLKWLFYDVEDASFEKPKPTTPVVHATTPTYQRLTQRADLTRLDQEKLVGG